MLADANALIRARPAARSRSAHGTARRRRRNSPLQSACTARRRRRRRRRQPSTRARSALPSARCGSLAARSARAHGTHWPHAVALRTPSHCARASRRAASAHLQTPPRWHAPARALVVCAFRRAVRCCAQESQLLLRQAHTAHPAALRARAPWARRRRRTVREGWRSGRRE